MLLAVDGNERLRLILFSLAPSFLITTLPLPLSLEQLVLLLCDSVVLTLTLGALINGKRDYRGEKGLN